MTLSFSIRFSELDSHIALFPHLSVIIASRPPVYKSFYKSITIRYTSLHELQGFKGGGQGWINKSDNTKCLTSLTRVTLDKYCSTTSFRFLGTFSIFY